MSALLPELDRQEIVAVVEAQLDIVNIMGTAQKLGSYLTSWPVNLFEVAPGRWEWASKMAVPTMAKAVGCSDRAIQNARGELVAAGVVERLPRRRPNGSEASSWLVFPALKRAAASPLDQRDDLLDLPVETPKEDREDPEDRSGGEAAAAALWQLALHSWRAIGSPYWEGSVGLAVEAGVVTDVLVVGVHLVEGVKNMRRVMQMTVAEVSEGKVRELRFEALSGTGVEVPGGDLLG